MKTRKGIWLCFVQSVILMMFAASSSAQLKADFSADPLSGSPPAVVTFRDLSTGGPTSWKWDLGNGTISFLKNPIATYFNPGQYTIKLIVRNSSGADSMVKSQYVVVNALPAPAFGTNKLTGCFPQKVKFTDSSLAGSGTLTKWQWDFGDGTLSSEQNPEHTYTSAGEFSVTLKVTNSREGSKTITKPALIVLKEGVKAAFDFTSTNGCASPATVTFANRTTGTGTIGYEWDFGNGGSSSAISPKQLYHDAGVYTVKLVAKNDAGCSDTLIKVNAINIGFVKAAFEVSPVICAGTPATFTNTSQPGSFAKVSWDFGDGLTSSAPNPLKSFVKEGTFSVKLVTDFGPCKDSVVRSIKVLGKPIASFTADKQTGCISPLVVSFSNTSKGAVSYKWNFGDNTSSTDENPQHTYTRMGEFAVSLIAINANGCTDTLTMAKFVKIVPPQILSLKGVTGAGCVPYSITPVAEIQQGTIISKYHWDFGDGNSSEEEHPAYTYTRAGKYQVSLVITSAGGCTDTLYSPDSIKVGIKAGTSFKAEPLSTCAFTPITFNDQSAGAEVHQWVWFFGDNTSSTLKDPSHAYRDTGYFDVTLITTNFGCSDTLTKTDFVYIKPPVARYDTAFFCNEPYKRTFVNKSIEAKVYTWSFGDGQTSNEASPVHTYTTAGVFAVTLKVANGACEHTITKNVEIVDEHGKLKSNTYEVCRKAPITYEVTGVQGTNISRYAWFTDSLTGAAVTVNSSSRLNLAYAAAGTRMPAVVMTDILGCRDTLTGTDPVITYGSAPAFASALPGTCLGNPMNFYDSSKSDGIHPITSWKWSFGEGTSNLLTASGNTSFTYPAPGSYDIILMVEDSYGCKDSIVKSRYVTITKPLALMVPSDTALCPSTTVRFTNQSQVLAPVFQWTFGDGASSADFAPVHAYPDSGAYTVNLRVTDKYGCTDSARSTINVYKAKAAFAMSDSFSTCPPLLINMTNKSTNFIDVKWDFGTGGNSTLINPSHHYTYPGTYKVTLTVTNKGGCTDVFSRNVVILGPTGIFTYSPTQLCNPGKADFKVASKNSIKYIFDYNDGNTIFSKQPAASHTFGTPGLYLPKVILEDSSGCRVPIEGLDTIKVNGVSTAIKSVNSILCDSGYVSFNDSTMSNDVVTGYMWNFGDGNVSEGKDPLHHYKKEGVYTVTLVTKTAFGCTDTAVSKAAIKVVSSPIVKIVGDTSTCAGAFIDLKGELIRKDTTIAWSWKFNNGTNANVQEPGPQQFTKEGTYHITLTTTNREGCSFTAKRNLVVHALPVVDLGPDTTICRYSSFKLNATGAQQYTWRADASLSCINCGTPVAQPSKTTSYFVTGKSVFGCVNTDSIKLFVKQPFKISVGKGDTLCKGEMFDLKASGGEKYNWYPASYLSDATSPAPTTKPDNTITYQVVASDSMNCFKDTGYVKLKVYPKPEMEITQDETVKLRVGSNMKLTTKHSADITKWQWYPARWLSCTNCAEPTAAPLDNITYNVVASNEGNCIARDQVNINVICDNANVFIPNTFTPNGDGVNDKFYPRGSGVFSIRSFKVFNRMGQIVFQSGSMSANDESKGWDGTFKGMQLTSDVYVYMLEVVCSNNVMFPYKGNISLIR